VLVVLVTFEPGVLLLILAAGVILAVSSGTGTATARTVVALAPVGASIVVIQSLAPAVCRPDCTQVAAIGPFAIYEEGLSRALVLVARLLAMEAVAVPLLATIHPSDLFAALRGLQLPFELALLLSLSFQLVPVLRRELDEVLAAHRARGFRGGGLAALGRALVPVVGGAFERMTTLVMALDARAMGAGPSRTSYRRVALGPLGVVASLLAAAAAVSGVAVAAARPANPTPAFAVPAGLAVAIVGIATLAFVAVLARAAIVLRRG
jgi:energy-coupling factor transport system permease protein